MRNAGLDESQAGIKMAGITRTSDMQIDFILMAENEEELKSLLMRVKEESEKADSKLNIQKLRSWHPDGGSMSARGCWSGRKVTS